MFPSSFGGDADGADFVDNMFPAFMDEDGCNEPQTGSSRRHTSYMPKGQRRRQQAAGRRRPYRKNGLDGKKKRRRMRTRMM